MKRVTLFTTAFIIIGAIVLAIHAIRHEEYVVAGAFYIVALIASLRLKCIKLS